MKPMISSFIALVSIAAFTAPIGHAQSCADQSAELQEKQSEAQEIAAARLTLLEEVEAAGDAWEDLEVHRLVSDGHAQTADEAKAKYNALKASLLQKEADLQGLVVTLNDGVAAYNQKCVKSES
jgi:hypothetical protein